ncbi:MAG: SMP-30/gluconolactonase/LRE family protein, partial [Flammeovirgaceae bacterium]
MKTFQKITWAFFVLLALFIGGIALNSCSIQPTAWTPQSKPEFTGALQLNDHLSNSVKLDLKGWNGAEDFAYDQEGNLYCGVHRGETNFSEGAILQFTPQGQMRVFLHTSGWVTGMEFDQSGNLIALIQGTGLVKITPNRQIIPLVQKDAQNRPILMGSGLTIATDGKIYFANLSATHTTSPKYINKLILELEKTGGVYCYHPKTNTIQTLSEGNYFANGLVLSKSEDYLLLSETSKYRVLRYWLKGAKAGTWEVFMDNL